MSTFKRVRVLLLPTNEKASNIRLNIIHNHLAYGKDLADIKTQLCQHLYFLSDKVAKTNEWFYNPAFNKLQQWLGEGSCAFGYPAIIATTDSSLKIADFPELNNTAYRSLPQPSQSFIEKYIEKYNKGHKIEEVMVEYECCGMIANTVNCCNNHKLKINPKDNTITIKPIKDSWSREEVEKLCRAAYKEAAIAIIPDYEDKWIEENL